MGNAIMDAVSDAVSKHLHGRWPHRWSLNYVSTECHWFNCVTRHRTGGYATISVGVNVDHLVVCKDGRTMKYGYDDPEFFDRTMAKVEELIG